MNYRCVTDNVQRYRKILITAVVIAPTVATKQRAKAIVWQKCMSGTNAGVLAGLLRWALRRIVSALS